MQPLPHAREGALEGSLQPAGTISTCLGEAARLAPFGGDRSATAEAVAFALASRLAELEARGVPIPVVVLEVRRGSEAEVLGSCIPWLAARGRRVLVRTRVVLPRSAVVALAACGGVVALEIASGRAPVQAALLGPAAAPAERLLLHAQYLAAQGVAVTVALGPVVDGWHEHLERTRPMWRHIVAADVRDATLWSVPLRSRQREALRGCGWVEPFWEAGGVPAGTRLALVRASIRREAEAAGVRIAHCGCSGSCHLGAEPSGYVPIAAPELFPRAS